MQLRLLGPTTVIYLQHLNSSCSIYSCFDSPVIDLTVIAAPNVTRYVPSHLLGLRPTSCPPPSPKPSPRWGDLPCLLTDNSDRKLLHVITLLKSQFTQPQQIILRWVPGVMETVFSTLHPASPALAKPWRSSVVVVVVGVYKNNFLLCLPSPRLLFRTPPRPCTHPHFPFSFSSHLSSSLLFYPWSLLRFQIRRTPACLPRPTLSLAKLDIIQVTEGVY